MIQLCVSELAADSECLTGNILTLQKCDPLFSGTTEPRTRFWRMVEFTSVCPLMPFLSGLKWFVTCFPSLTLLWLLFCADEVSRKPIEHVIYYTCAIHYWEMARSVPNWSCPKWEHENITVPFLFNPHMSCDRRNQPCSKPLLAMSPLPLPPTAAPGTPGECCPPQPFSVTGRCLQLKFWVWPVIQRFTHWHFLSISKLLVLQKNWQWSACLK